MKISPANRARAPGIQAPAMVTFPINPKFARTATFCPVNKNFCHYPLARSSAVAPPWRATSRKTRRFCVLHRQSENRKALVTVSLSASTLAKQPDLERLPSRFDLGLLLRLTALTALAQSEERHRRALEAGRKRIKATDPKAREYTRLIAPGAYDQTSWQAEVAGEVKLEFKSLRFLLQCLGRSPDASTNRAAVRESLRLWSVLNVRYCQWYEKGDKEDKRFGPFIEYLKMPDAGRGPVIIRLSQDYMATISRRKGYFLKVPLPLPLASEAALNLSLFLPLFDRTPPPKGKSPVYEFAAVCDRLGIAGDESWRRYERLGKAMDAVNKHLKCSSSRKRYGIKSLDEIRIRFVEHRIQCQR